MQLKQYQAQQLKIFLESQLKHNISGVLTLETTVSSWQKQRRGMLVIYNGALVYADSVIPNNQQLAKSLGDKLQPNFINAALALATEKLTNPQSVRELIEILVKLRIFQWDNVEKHIHNQVVLILERFNAYPGQARWENSSDFDLCFGEDRHGLNWTKLKQDLNHRQQLWASLAPTIPSMDAVPYISDSSLLKVSDPRVREHLKRYVDGHLTLVEIANVMGKDPLKVANSYSNWVKSGAVNFDDPPEANNQNIAIASETSEGYLPTILSVDDSQIVQISIKRILTGRYNLLFASQAADALKILNRNSVDLVLLDLTMPDVDGLDFCKIIRKIPQFQNLPIIMVTARDGFFDKIKGQMAGSNGYITKPFKPEELLEMINKYLKVRQG
ncbi:MAG: response regulator [Xenococcus sp. MO_188.B8]|nr:response regulator [Xenococcus sp. MO_188.B8]